MCATRFGDSILQRRQPHGGECWLPVGSLRVKTIFFTKNVTVFTNTPLFSQTQWTVPARSKLFAGVLRALRAIGRPMCATRFGNRILQPSLLLHGIGTGPANRAPFQSTGPRADIIKLEDCTASRTASLD